MTRPVLPAALLALALSLSACGDDADAPAVEAPAGVVTTVPAAPTPDATGAPATPPASAPATPAPTAASPGPTPTTSAAAAARSAAPAPAAARTAPVKATAPSLATRAGRYTYDSRGTVTAGAAPRSFTGTSTLTVDAPVKGTQSLVLEGDQGRTETDTVLRGDGRYVSRLLLTTPAFSKEFAPSPPALLLPEDASVGKRWTFTVKSTDGRTTATARNRIVRTEKVTVGGRSVDTRVVESVLSLRGDIVFDGTTTTNYATAQRLPVREKGTGKGTVGGFAFSTDTSSALRSLDPSQ